MRKHNKLIKRTKSELIFEIVNYLFLTMLTLVFVLPFITVLSTSFVSSEEAARRGSFILLPNNIDFSAYKILLAKGSLIWNGYKITFFRVIVGTILNLTATSMLAYGLSKKKLPGRNAIIGLIFITMIFTGGLVPTYLLMKSLGLINSIWVLVLPMLINPWWLIIMKNFFAQIPDSIEESASMDGASAFTILFRIILPLSTPILATIGLFYAVWHWNSWFDAAIYLTENTKWPVQVIMRNIVLSMSNSDLNQEVLSDLIGVPPPPVTIRSALIVITTIPILLVYPFLQKHFVKGIIIGSVKG
jgi:ABC-type glycerol-3-phosphate transport system permease component